MGETSESVSDSANETKGRCRAGMRLAVGMRCENEVLADGIDRLAADVAAIKEAVCDGSVAAERDRFLAGMDAAIRERDEARKQVESMTARFMEARKAFRAEAERGTTLKAELAAAQAEAQRIQDEADDREETERVKRLKAEIEKTHRALLNRTCERDEARKERDEAISERDGSRALFDLVQIQRTAAYADRDEARADAERLYAELAARPAAAGASDEIAALQFLVNKYRNKSEAYGGMVRGCCPALERAGHPVDGRGPDGAVGGIARAVEAMVRERDEARAEVERLRAELAARPAAGWLSEDECWKLRVAVEHLKRLGSETAETIDAILARAGSPPVVEVPALKFLGPMTGREQGIVLAYRDALDSAGIPWKEKGVPRE